MHSQCDLYERAKNMVYYSILNYCESVKQKSILQDSPYIMGEKYSAYPKRFCTRRNAASSSWWTDWPSRLCWDTHLCAWSALDSNVRLWIRPWNELGHVAAVLVYFFFVSIFCNEGCKEICSSYRNWPLTAFLIWTLVWGKKEDVLRWTPETSVTENLGIAVKYWLSTGPHLYFSSFCSSGTIGAVLPRHTIHLCWMIRGLQMQADHASW